MKWIKMIDTLRKRDLLPVVIFAFSKKKCENLAEGLSTIDLTKEIQPKIEKSNKNQFGIQSKTNQKSDLIRIEPF